MKSILIAGVGGQGTLLASVVLGKVAMKEGRDVKLSEVHGMAQRGGSVVTYVRIGDIGENVSSPLIEPGGADILLAFEQLEAVRWLHYVRPVHGSVYVNVQKIYPMPVITGTEPYPAGLEQQIMDAVPKAVLIDALALAEQAGNLRTVNTVLIGAMATATPFSLDTWLGAIADTVRPQFAEVNKNAFMLGYETTRNTTEG